MNKQQITIIGAVVGVGLLLLVCVSGPIFSPMGLSALNSFAGVVILLLVAGFALVKAFPYLTGAVQQRPTPPIREVLRRAFEKNYTVRVQTTLESLPDWPIRPVLQGTARQLFALKFAAQRAQEEGVPALFIGRMQSSVERAADSVWEIASKIDAVARQQIDYALIEPRLQIEAQKLQQLIGSLKRSQEGIALLTLSATHHDALQGAEGELQTLSQVVKLLEQTAL